MRLLAGVILSLVLGSTAPLPAAGPPVAANGTIFPAQEFSTGPLPRSAVHGDFNGDGFTDLALSASSEGITLLLGRGDGTFHDKHQIPGHLSSLLAGEFTGDTQLDLVATGMGGTWLYTGRGDGTFLRGEISSHEAGFLASGDLNGDGILDLVTTGGQMHYDWDIQVFLGNGDGTFGLTLPLSPRPAPSALILEVTGDSFEDLVLGGYPHMLTVYPGLGDGNFGSPAHVPSVLSPVLLAAGDLNHDGVTDIVATSGDAGGYTGVIEIEAFRGDGAGGFESSWTYNAYEGWDPRTPPPLPLLARSITVADLGGDGTLDLVAAGHFDQVAVFPGHGDGTFRDHPVSLDTGADPLCVASADFDRDGLLDIATTHPYSGRDLVDTRVFWGNVVIFRGIQGSFLEGPLTVEGQRSLQSSSADFDGDGAEDLVTLGVPPVCLHRLNPSGEFDAVCSDVRIGDRIAAGDFDEDGRADLAGIETYRFTGSHLTIALSGSDGIFTLSDQVETRDRPQKSVRSQSALAPESLGRVLVGSGSEAAEASVPDPPAPVALTVADVNGDGHLDVIVGFGHNPLEPTVREVAVYPGKGDGTLGALIGPVPVPVGRFQGTWVRMTLAAADLDSDGRQDLLTRSGNVLNVLSGNGDGTFGVPLTFETMELSPGLPGLLVEDFNDDGFLDALVTNVWTGANNPVAIEGDLTLFQGDGSGALSEAWRIPLGVGPMALASGDFNEDGLKDIIAGQGFTSVTGASGRGDVAVLLGAPEGGFLPPTYHASGAGYVTSLALGDWDRDGHLDIAAATNLKVSLLLNRLARTRRGRGPCTDDDDPDDDLGRGQGRGRSLQCGQGEDGRGRQLGLGD